MSSIAFFRSFHIRNISEINWELTEDCLRIDWELTDDCLKIAWKLTGDWLRIHWRLTSQVWDTFRRNEIKRVKMCRNWVNELNVLQDKAKMSHLYTQLMAASSLFGAEWSTCPKAYGFKELTISRKKFKSW